MRVLYYFLFLSQIFSSCKSKPIADVIILKGTIRDIPANKLYLTQANHWNKFIDSANYIKDGFSFQIQSTDTFTPIMVSIAIIDTLDGKIKTLYFRNSILSPAPDSTKYLTNFFILERGVTEIRGIYNSYNQLDISAGIETLAMFRTQMMSFGYIDGDNKAGKEEAIRLYKKIITDYPSSYHLLEKIFENKELYTSAELNEYLSLFTPELQKSNLSEILKEYISTRPNPTSNVPELILATEKGNKSGVIDQSAKLNMLVFWASWCAPCRAEIPELKKIYTDLNSQGLSISSISIDEKEESWKGAMLQEKMPWRQFIVDSADIKRVKQEYDFSAIPFTILVDKHGKVITRSVGFDPQKSYQERTHFLDSLLKNY